ncbi:hypothetical protein PV10_06350 [Exophiala mesophila]|uniref:Arrestin C-terminal-like domain-containing protein n=1 Tax=Exophiala mesophila TaxID=212818 RepID=A0A0D1ZY88_EXOME|nr:uncharacterized protein PV10_06350 [Exophiala mesophila]KIV91858.1 hypothetical protein PV10_06350 [Exophiala mesophila]
MSLATSNDGHQFRPRRTESRLSSLKATAHQEDHQIHDRIECRQCIATPPQGTLPRSTITQHENNHQHVAAGTGAGGDASGGCPHISHPRLAQRDQHIVVSKHNPNAHEIQLSASIPAPEVQLQLQAQHRVTSSALSTVIYSSSEGILSPQEELGRQEPNPDAEQARARQHLGGFGFGRQQGSLSVRLGVGPTTDYPTLATPDRLGLGSLAPTKPEAPEAVTLGCSTGAERAKGPDSATSDRQCHHPGPSEPRVSRASREPERPECAPEAERVPAPVLGESAPPSPPTTNTTSTPTPTPTRSLPSSHPGSGLGSVPVPVPTPRALAPSPLSAGLTANVDNIRNPSTANVTNVAVPVDQRLITSRVSFPICPFAIPIILLSYQPTCEHPLPTTHFSPANSPSVHASELGSLWPIRQIFGRLSLFSTHFGTHPSSPPKHLPPNHRSIFIALVFPCLILSLSLLLKSIILFHSTASLRFPRRAQVVSIFSRVQLQAHSHSSIVRHPAPPTRTVSCGLVPLTWYIDSQLKPILRRSRKHSPSECQHEPALRSTLTTRPSRSSSNSSIADRHLLKTTPPSKSSAMALKFLTSHSSHSGSSSSVKYFDIRLDNDYIVFRGSEDEASSAELSGSVVLCLTDILNIAQIHLTLSGIVHMSYQASSSSSMSGRRTNSKEKTFFEKNWTFRDPGKGKTEMLCPDNYEWPFSCILEGGLPESVEGLKDAWVIYRLKAEVVRKRGRDIVVRKPLRVVRTLDASALELAHAMSVENIWPNKIEYSISIPNKAVAFGSFVQVDFKLIPLLKGLVIGNVSTQVKEEQEFVVDPEWGVSAVGGGQIKQDRVIVADLHRINVEDEQILDETAEGFEFSRYLELPKSLNHCLQDCNTKGIKVRHKVKFNVQLHNPDGHISELRANLPVSLYISPSLPINENNDLVDQTPQASRAAIANDLANAAPPVYGKHTLDTLYSDIDGYRTPGTALSTPGTPYLHSRHASSDNLASLAAITNGNYVSPVALQNRLQDLRVGFVSGSLEDDHNIPMGLENGQRSQSQEDYFVPHESSNGSANTRFSPYDASRSGGQSGTPSQPGSNLMSRRTSEEEDGTFSGARTPFPQYDHMEDLNLIKIPSYTTAVKTPAPRTQRSSSTLPTYDASVREPSPPTLMEPPTAHIRNSPRLPGSLANSPPDSLMNGSRIAASHRTVSSIQDDERRLRLMQQRGR